MHYERFETCINTPLLVVESLVRVLDKNPHLGFVRLNECLADAIVELKSGMRAYASHPLTSRERYMMKSIYRALSLAEDAWLKGIYRYVEIHNIRKMAYFFLPAEE